MKNGKKLPVKYLVTASLAMYLAPYAMILLSAVVMSFIGIEEFILFLTCAAIVFFSYSFGKYITTSEKLRQPENRAALYAPAFLPAAALPIAYMIVTFFVKNDTLQFILLMPNLWSVYVIALSDAADLDLSCLFGFIPAFALNVLYGLFFVWGERIGAKKNNIAREKFKIGYAAAFAAYFAVFCGALSYCDHYNDITDVTVGEGERLYYVHKAMSERGEALFGNGYGFVYEDGWSSVDLHPYYVENENNLLAKLDEPAAFRISEASEMPVLDGAEAAYPVYSAFANACYDNIGDIQEYAKSKEGEEENAPKPIRFTNTIEAYKSLVSGGVDIFFGAEPSAEQKKLAEEAGRELLYTPLGKEAFVFFVSEDNPVDGLTSEQIRDIYSGKITNWKKVGGRNLPILAFQRPKNSGSQTKMERFMGDTPLKEPLKVEFEYSMAGVISAVADYQNKETAIGYSFRYYASQMTFGNNSGVKFLSLDGVYPSAENIADSSYPMTGQLYAISLADNDNENVGKFLDFMVSEQGRQLVGDTGYIV